MSEELLDELEAINSIYGEGCLVKANDSEGNVYILTPPEESSSLRIEFPADYPNEPPTIIGTNSIGDGKRGEAAQKLELFQQAVGARFQPGVVCLFEAIEEFMRLLEEESALEKQKETLPEPREDVEGEQVSRRKEPTLSEILGPEPPWVLSDPFVELRSTFVGRCAKVASVEEAEGFVQHLLATDKKVRSATHNITAWRIRGPNNTSFQDCDDDGETAAGGRLLHLMQLMDIWDAMIVVTRWYGGHKLGPRRFALINQTARDAFVKAGLVVESANPKKKGSGK